MPVPGYPMMVGVIGKRRTVTIGTALVAVVVTAAGGWLWHRSQASALLAVDDPAPRVAGQSTAIGPEGGSVRLDALEVVVPPGAVGGGGQITVLRTEPLGERLGELFGQPAGVEHAEPLRAKVTLRWNVPELTEQQRATALLTKWDPQAKVWQRSAIPLRIEGDTLVAEVVQFSFWNWVANAGQAVGELLGKRARAPECSGKALHAWVRQVVDPDEDVGAASIRVCFEPDRDEIITARVVNNRTFTQRLHMTDGEQEWAWTWPGRDNFGPRGVVYTAARTAFDSRITYLVPPLSEVAVGIGQPAQPGQATVTVAARVDGATVLLDAAAYVFDSVPIGGLANPLANAFLQSLFECGGKQLLGKAFDGGADAVLRGAVDAVVSCANEIVRPTSEFGARFEALEQQAIRAHPGLTAAVVARADRLVHQLAKAYAVLKFFDLAFLVSDQLANTLAGPLSFAIRGDGRPQQLGAWQPACDNVDTDSSRLYRNLALQEIFSNEYLELWQFPEWPTAARQAVVPLDACDDLYLHRLAGHLTGDWADAKAAGMVADEIRALTAFPTLPDPVRMQQLGVCRAACTITGHILFDHPEWGPSVLVTTLSPEHNDTDTTIVVIDAKGELRWRHQAGNWYALAPASPARDKTGHLFLNYDPGRYNGVIILHPAPGGFEHFETLPAPGDYQSRFYSATLTDVDGDGQYEVDLAINDCNPSCAQGTIHHTIFRWNGTNYIS